MWFLKNEINQTKTLLWLIGLAALIMGIIFVWNLLSGEKGSYMDLTPMMIDLMKKDVRHEPQKKMAFESKGEIECRRAVEKITGKQFPKSRPDFMLNHISGQNLELDCYNDELKTAIEYNGEQHYKYIPYFHASKDAFYNLKYRDDIKKRLCEQNNITLITVPYTVKNDNIENYISQRLK
jgi:hypothetical protein